MNFVTVTAVTPTADTVYCPRVESRQKKESGSKVNCNFKAAVLLGMPAESRTLRWGNLLSYGNPCNPPQRHQIALEIAAFRDKYVLMCYFEYNVGGVKC